MSVDMTYHRADFEETPLATTETLQLAQAKADSVNRELLALKDNFEEIFEDHDWAIQEAKCRLLEDGERVPGDFSNNGAESSTSSQGEASRANSEVRTISSSDRERTVEPIWIV